jgi:hypothetical protein
MTIVATDWSVTRSNGNIRYIGDDHGGASPSYATVIELHRWLGDLADDASSAGNDEIDITDELPSGRSTDNIITLLGNYNIDDTAAEHLYDGSIIQAAGAEIYDGIVNFGNADVQIQIIQNGTVLADDWWNFGGGGLNANAAQGISHRFMIKTRTGGADIDGRRLIGTSRTFGNTYSEFSINGTARGNNVLALTDSADLNNQTVAGTVATWTTITNTEGFRQLDVNNNGSDEDYYSEWNRDAYTINQLFERAKWLTRDGSAETIYGLSGELFRGITHEINIDTNTGTFSAVEAVSWTGGTGQMLAIDSTTAGTKMWIQLLTGVSPTDGQVITGGTSSATAAVNVTVTDRSSTLSKPFIGVSTGSAIIGAYGVGIETADLSATDKVTDLTNTVINPPNAVTFTVGGLVNGEDRVLVAPWDGSTLDGEGNPAIDKAQDTINGSLTGAAVTSVVTTTAIPSDTPSSGGIRIELDDGSYKDVAYTSYTGSTYTITSTDFSGTNATTGNNIWIAYIDELASGTVAAFSAIYSADRDLVVIVRDGGVSPIKQFITSASLGSTGGSVTTIRTSDE